MQGNTHDRPAVQARLCALLQHPLLPWIIAGFGILLRGLWAVHAGPAIGEAGNVAAAIAEGKGFADSYQAGQGPTAHLLPTVPLFAGGVYLLLGHQSVLAEIVLQTVATILEVGSALLFWRAFRQLAVPVWACNLALAFMAFLSPYLSMEAHTFRIWEGALAVFLAAAMLNLILVRAFDLRPAAWRAFVPLALVGAATFFTNPVMGVGCYVATVMLVLRHVPPTGWLPLGLVGAVALAAPIVPWAMRNAAVMESPVLLRSNAGLELALANYPGAADPGSEPGKTFDRRLEEIHPAVSLAAFRRMQQAGGEVAYARMLGKQAKAWMIAHPSDVGRIMVRHLGQTFVPPEWLTARENLRGVKILTLLADLVGVCGLLGLALALVRRQSGWLYPAILILLPALAFSLFQPIPRYNYNFFGLLSFSAANGVAAVAATMVAGWRRPRRLRNDA